MQAILFQNTIENFMYAMVCTKPDITHAMGVVNQFMVNLEQSHWIVMKRIFRYLKGIMDFGMRFNKNIEDVIMGTMHHGEDVNHSQG